jgi:glycosyltransferase involved in cell wall biosynthesis
MGRDTAATQAHHLRVLMIAPTSFFADYGCHVRVLEEVRALTARGHRVRICTYHNGDNLPGLDIRRSVDIPWLRRAEVGSSRHKAYLDLALCVESMRQALMFRPHVIHGHLHEGALIGSVVGRLTGTPVVFDYQGSLTEEMLDHGFIRRRGRRERFFRWLERRIDRLPDVVVPSSVAGEGYLSRSGLRPSRVIPIGDAVDTARFNPDAHLSQRDIIRSSLGIPAHARVVIYLGLLAEYQGTSLLIEAARQVLRRRSDVWFVIAGYPGADRYALQAQDMPLAQRVLFPGRIAYQDAPGLLVVGDVAVAPKLSTTEGNGKLFNYMAMRLPVVATDTPINRSVLGELGHLVPLDRPDLLADAIERAFDDSDGERSALRRRVIDCYSWEQRVTELERVYVQVLGGTPERPLARWTARVLTGD